jgi:hypothetical protein
MDVRVDYSSRRRFLQQAAALPLTASAFMGRPACSRADDRSPPFRAQGYDVFVYGSTPGGIAAALQAARGGCTVLLACPQRHPGGMAASGLCTTDAVRRHLFGGLVAEFVGRVRKHYENLIGPDSPEWKLIQDGWYYAPSAAEKVFVEMLGEQRANLDYRPGVRLTACERKDAQIHEVSLRTGAADVEFRISVGTCIDGTYEGDLAAKAGVPFRVGREASREYGESLGGIHYMNWRTGTQIMTPDTGEASPAIQSFCARSIFTDDPAKRVPIEKPDTYAEHVYDYLPLIEDFESGRIKNFRGGVTLPGRRFEMNGNIEWRTSFNCPGVSWNWPDAEPEHRARLAKFHVDHAAGMMWFLQNDPRVPPKLRDQVATWGLHADEFTDDRHWPWQIYVRQGRRIVGREIVTQNHFIVDPQTKQTPRVHQPIALGEHSFDIHPCHDRRYAVDGFMEGVLWYPKKANGPAQPGQVPWGAIVPRGIDNLLVPVAVSATHVAFSVLRMEPTWMTLGQLAGEAAVAAKTQRKNVAEIDPLPLPKKLGILTEPPTT